MAVRTSHSIQENGKKVRIELSALKVNLSTIFGLVIAGGVMTWIVVIDGIRDISFSLSSSLIPVYLERIANLTAQ